MKKEMNAVKVWDIFIRIFHWTLVGSIIGLYLSGEEFKSVHIRLGYFVTCLVLARIIWGFVGTKHARFNNFLYRPRTIYDYLKSLIKGNPKHYLGHNPAGGIMTIVMLITLLVTVFTGLKTLAMEGKGPLATTDISISRVVYADEDEHDNDPVYRDGQHYKDGHRQKEQKDELWEDIHELMTSFIIFLIIVHVGGVIVSSWIHKENLIMGMITGIKKKE
jgi:cytochrome b